MNPIIIIHMLLVAIVYYCKFLLFPEIPPPPNNLIIPLESLTRERFSLTWTEPVNVFGGISGYQVTVRSNQSGDVTRLCGRITAPNEETAPLRNLTDWVATGQTCYFSTTTVTGDRCGFVSTSSQEVTITLQGSQTISNEGA